MSISLSTFLRPSFWLAGLAGLAACSNWPYPKGPIESLYPEPPRPVEMNVQVGDRTLHYLQMDGAHVAPRIVFIHGSPGDWKAYAKYLVHPDLQPYVPLIVVDRPGYGGSGAGQMVPSLTEQARLLAPLLDDPQGPAIVVGHSLGRPIAVMLAMDYPDKVRGVVTIAGSDAPEFERASWYNALAGWRVVQWVLPRELTDSNRELINLEADLRAMESGWKTLRAPVTVIQGGQDDLVDPREADYVDAQLAGKPHHIIRVPDAGHFVIWRRMDLVTRALTDLIQETAAPPTGASS